MGSVENLKNNSDDDDQVQIEELWNQTTNQKPEVSINQKEEMAQFGTNAESLLYLQECINDLQVFIAENPEIS